MNLADWSTPATIIALIAALGLGNLAPKLLTRLWQAATGQARRDRAEIDRLRAEVWRTRTERDAEATHRRRLQEALSQTRRAAFDHGLDEADLPPVPGRSGDHNEGAS